MPNNKINQIQPMSSSGTRDQVQLSFGRAIDWETINPILLAGECACVFDSDTLSPSDFKFGNGISTFKQLPSILKNEEILKVVYTKAQIDALFTVANALIATHTLQLSGAIDSITQLTTNFATLEANSAEALLIANAANTTANQLSTSTTNSLKGITDKLDPLATAQNYLISVSAVKKLIQDAQGFNLTPDQLNALNSGITLDKLSTLTSNTSTNTTNISTLTTTSAANTASIQNLVGVKANKDTNLYYQSATRVSGGNGYSLYAPCTVNGIKGFITRIENEYGAIALDGITLLQTRSDCSTAPNTPAPVISEMGGSGASFTVLSIATTNDLQDATNYLERVLSLTAASHLDRGKLDNLLRVVQNGKLVPVNAPPTTKYVDASYSGIEQGLEFCPFTTGRKALDALGAGTSSSPNTTPGAIYYAAGNYTEDLNLQHATNKNIVGLAVAQQCRTKINSITIGTGAGSIGLRDLLTTTLTLTEGSGNNYLDNISVEQLTTIGSANYNYASHCSFRGDVTITSGTVEFDSCDFRGTVLTIQTDATVIVKDCTNISVQVGSGASYTHLSGTATLKGTNIYAIAAHPAAKFVGLYGGTAIDAKGLYAPINIPSTVPCAIGLFLFKAEGSVLPSASRLPVDGLSSLQVVAGKREGVTEGYKSSSIYLSDHLDKISEAISSIIINQHTEGITDVQVSQGPSNGQISLIVTNSTSPTPVTTTASVYGLKSAAYTNANDYATSAQGTLADTAYQKPASGIPYTHMAPTIAKTIQEAEQSINKIAVVSSTATDIQYPTAKALYTQAIAPIEKVITHLPANMPDTAILATEKLVETQIASLTSRNITPKAETQGNEGDFWPSMASLRNPASSSLNYYYQGVLVAPQSNDEATYLISGEQWKAQYDGKQWQAKYKLGQQFSASQQSAVDSGITLTKVTQISTNETSIGKKQDKVTRAATQSAIQVLTDSTIEGSFGKLSIDTLVSPDKSGIPNTSAVLTALAQKQDCLTKPTSGSAFVTIDSAGATAIDNTKYVSTTDALTTYLNISDAASTYFTKSDAIRKQDKIPAGTAGDLVRYSGTEGKFSGYTTTPAADTVGISLEISATSTDNQVPTSKAVHTAIETKQRAIKKTIKQELLATSTTTEGEITTYTIDDDGLQEGVKAILTRKGTLALIDKRPLTLLNATKGTFIQVGESNALSPTPYSPTSFIHSGQGQYTRLVTEKQRLFHLVSGAAEKTPQVYLDTNTFYIFPEVAFEAGKTPNDPLCHPRLWETLPRTDIKMFNNVTMSSGLQSANTDVTLSQGLYYNRVYAHLASKITNTIFNNSIMRFNIGSANTDSSILVNDSTINLFTREEGTEKGLCWSITSKHSKIEVKSLSTKPLEIILTPMDSIIDVYGASKIILPTCLVGKEAYNKSATIYLHAEATLDASELSGLDSIAVIICKDSTAETPIIYPKSPESCTVIDLKNNTSSIIAKSSQNLIGKHTIQLVGSALGTGDINETGAVTTINVTELKLVNNALLTPFTLDILAATAPADRGWTPGGGFEPFYYTIPATQHQKGKFPNVKTYIGTTAGNKEETYDSPKISANGDVTVFSSAPIGLCVVITY